MKGSYERELGKEVVEERTSACLSLSRRDFWKAAPPWEPKPRARAPDERSGSEIAPSSVGTCHVAQGGEGE